LPQFFDAAAGSVLAQSLLLTLIALCLTRRPSWMPVRRYLMGTVLAGLAVRMAFEVKPA
jgi:threonine/homoserine/homoserine lactone efflux protein